MVSFKYFVAWIKRNSLANLIPLVFVVPIITLVFVNLLSSFGDDYNNLVFITNSSFKSRYSLPSKEMIKDENFFIEINTIANGLYDPDLNVAGSEYYGSNTNLSIYFCNDTELLSTSYFSEDNLLIGSLPKGNDFQKKLSNGTYPIYISYNAAKDLKSETGDIIYVNLIKSMDEESIKTLNVKYGFTIIGIIRPCTSTNEYSEFQTKALALIDTDAFNEISNYSLKKTFITFTNKELDSSLELLKKTKAEDVKEIINNLTNVKAILLYSAVFLVIVIVTFMEMGYIKKKKYRDLKILRLLGMNSYKAKTIILYITTFVLIIGVIGSLLITKYIIIEPIILKYYDWLCLLLLGVSILLSMLVSSIMFLIFQKLDS